MKRRTEFPNQERVWTIYAPRIEARIVERKQTVLELSGFFNVFGHPGDGFTGEQEGDRFLIELAGQTSVSFAEDLQERCDSARLERQAGRPCDVLTRELGPRLPHMFERFHPPVGRRSV